MRTLVDCALARACVCARARGCVSNLFLQKAALVSWTSFLVIKLSKCFVVIRPIVRSSLFSVLVYAEVASLFGSSKATLCISRHI